MLLKKNEEVVEIFVERIKGRIFLNDVYDLLIKEFLVVFGDYILNVIVEKIENFFIEFVEVCFVLICEVKKGICV